MSQATLPRTASDAATTPATALPVRREPASGGLRVLALILVAKTLVFALAWWGYQSVPLASEVYEGNHHYHQPAQYGLLTRFTTWDSSHYLLLARDGYPGGADLSNAFAPLLPLSIRAVATLTGDYVIAGLLVSNAAAAAALWLLWALVRRRWGQAMAWRTLLLLLAFPTAFFLSMVYTESLFLLLAVATFWALDLTSRDTQHARWLAIAALAAFLLPLTRWIGLAIALPLGVWAATNGASKGVRGPLALRGPQGERFSFRTVTSSVRPDASWLLVLAPILGAAVYLAYMQAETGDWLAHVHAARLFPAHWELTTLLQPWRLWDTTFGHGLSLHGQLDSAVDRLLFVAFVASAPLVYRRTGPAMFAFYVLMGIQPLMGSYMSYSRYLLLAFPLFIAWGSVLAERPRLMPGVVAALVLIQAMSVVAHTSSHWVA